MLFTLPVPANRACVIRAWWMGHDRVAFGAVRPDLDPADPDLPMAYVPYLYGWEYAKDWVPLGPWPVKSALTFETQDNRQLVATLHGSLMLRPEREAVLWACRFPLIEPLPDTFMRMWKVTVQDYLAHNKPLSQSHGRKPELRHKLLLAANEAWPGLFDIRRLQVGIDLPASDKAKTPERATQGPFGASHP